MDVVILLVFISLVLVAAGLIFFVSRLRGGDFDHGERLALSPLANDDGREAPSFPAESKEDVNEEVRGRDSNVGS